MVFRCQLQYTRCDPGGVLIKCKSQLLFSETKRIHVVPSDVALSSVGVRNNKTTRRGGGGENDVSRHSPAGGEMVLLLLVDLDSG